MAVRVKNWDEMFEPAFQPEYVLENDPVGTGMPCRQHRLLHLLQLLEAGGHRRQH